MSSVVAAAPQLMRQQSGHRVPRGALAAAPADHTLIWEEPPKDIT